MKPTSVTVLGKQYTITYCDKPSEVDLFHRESLWGQIDYWTRTIRIYDNGRSEADLWHSIFHEVFHAIAEELGLACLQEDAHDRDLDRLALALADTCFLNGWFQAGAPETSVLRKRDSARQSQ